MMETKKLQAVVIDDDPSDIVLIQRYLEQIPEWEVDMVVYHDATSGVAELALRHPHFVILDHMLGSETGLEVIEQIRKVGYKGPLLFLTGRGDEELAVQAWKAGVDDYLPKRVLSTSSLKRTISNCMEKHKLRTAIEEHRQKLQDTNQRLTRKTEEIRTFYHAVSHELKTPLTSAREFIAILIDGIAGPINDEQSQYLETARESLDQMTHYINDLLDSTRLETAKLNIESDPTSLGAIVEYVTTALIKLAEKKGVRLTSEIEPDLPPVQADRRRIAQVISNLVSNAIKFTPEGGSIVIQARMDDKTANSVRVSVRDTGCGIAAEHQERVFDRLYQVDRSDSPSHGGLGLGLNICKGIVALHGGTIWVESEPGKGSEFIFTLPVESVPAMAQIGGNTHE